MPQNRDEGGIWGQEEKSAHVEARSRRALCALALIHQHANILAGMGGSSSKPSGRVTYISKVLTLPSSEAVMSV